MKKILIGKIIKPQGIKGELKVLPICDSAEVFKSIKKYYINDKEFTPVSVRIADGLYVVLYGIADRNTAEEMRNKLIYADKNDVPVDDEKWFISDIISCKIFDENGNFIGTVSDVSTRGSTDFFTAATPSEKTVQFPFLKKILKQVDVENKSVVVYKKSFDEVAYYED